MKVVIRTDASIEIGTGHVMRCITLAKQLRNEGATVTFLCRKFPGNSMAFIAQEGFQVVSLPYVGEVDNIEWTRNNWKQDAEDTKSILEELYHEVNILIIDHYGLDTRWEKKIKSYVNKIMVIDDLADRPHDCDLLLDQNYYLNMHDRYSGLVPDDCVQLLGPDYILLRDEFLNVDINQNKRTGEINNILIFFGGSDPTGETLKALIAVRNLDIPEINVVVGAVNPRKEQVEQLCAELSNVKYYCQVNNMANLMLKADLAIGAGGATTWERCYLKLPSLVTILAPNQLKLTNDVASTGTLINLGYHTEVTASQIEQAVARLLKQPQEMAKMIAGCLAIINIERVRERPILAKIMEMSQWMF